MLVPELNWKESSELLEGFGNFCLPPTEDELKAEERAGPINYRPRRTVTMQCIPFAKKQPEIKPLELLKLKLQDIEAKPTILKSARSSLTSVLAWLWEVIARPCLDELGLKQPHSDGPWAPCMVDSHESAQLLSNSCSGTSLQHPQRESARQSRIVVQLFGQKR